MPELTEIRRYGFQSTALNFIYMPKLGTVHYHAIHSTKLHLMNFPMLTQTLKTNTLSENSILKKFFAINLEVISNECFSDC